MTRRADTDDFRTLFLNDVPLMDVRAPTEFQKGSFPLASNAPLMSDEERHRVGIRYKEQGQSSAIDLGHQLVRDDIRQERVNQWVRFANSNPDGYLFCFRGGLRSRIVQEWMAEAGMDYPLIEGGYKALRRFLIDELEAICHRMPIILVSGRTGTGKTRLLDELPNPVDLEGMANHRGSSFGRTLTPQPGQINFENRLAVAMMKAWHHGHGPAFLEDESALIGRCRLPDVLRERMAEAPMVILERPLDERVGIILQDYVTDMVTAFVDRDGHEAGWMNFREHLLSALDRIRKRLGGARHQTLRDIMERALDRQQESGDLGGHRDWIVALLRDYYDPMYDYQLDQREGRILVRDSADRLRAWAGNDAPSLKVERTTVAPPS